MSKIMRYFILILSGTITDSALGITNSVMYALKSSASKRQIGQNYINLSVRRLQSPLRNFTVLQKSRVWME